MKGFEGIEETETGLKVFTPRKRLSGMQMRTFIGIIAT
jgi:hypothetical protein